MPKSEQPEPERLVRLYCYDWSPYECEGKFVKYKPGSGKRTGNMRFMQKDQFGDWVTNTTAWKDCDNWEYVK